MCEHVGLECPAGGCFCECERCEAVRQTDTERCDHRADWVPEALIFDGREGVAAADVVCFFEGCGWSGRVSFSEELSLREIQGRAYGNKVAKGFNTTDVPMEFGLTMEELGEAFSAWRKQRPVGPELADVLIFVAGIAEITGCDLAAEVERKLALHAVREYEFLTNGTPVKSTANGTNRPTEG